MNSVMTSPVTAEQASKAYALRGGSIPLNQVRRATDAELTKKADEFEQMFLNQMLQHMFEGVETNEAFGGGVGEDTYKSFMVEEYSKMVQKTGGLGIADHVKAEMIRMQDTQPQAVE